MIRTALLSAAAAGLCALPAFAQSPDPHHAAAHPDAASAPYAGPGVLEARASLIDRDRAVIGEALFRQGPNGVVITLSVDGLGEARRGAWHGAHLHKIGDCSNADFTSSGGHINVGGASHGYLSADGPDNADLPNLWVHQDGALRAQIYTSLVSIDGQTDAPALLDEDGSAFVMHENPDDMTTQPIGGAGGRIVCGVIEAVQ